MAEERTHDSAGCAIFDESGKVLLVHQTYGKKLWHLPGGIAELGESPWIVAKRECMEEVSIDVELGPLSGLYFLSHRNAYVFIFKATKFTGEPTPDGAEIDQWGYFDVNDLPSPMENFTVTRIRDAHGYNGIVTLRDQNVRDYRVGGSDVW
ncbi:NUDIX hydrolase [Alicyclobacillus fodiniaquatilis]|uniref:NUDIX hydrolase n=1 Tax=Alicyclobacillus fodiniaquatilis TaxID=1661150 RepID=A0ABW4JQH8_9BACL